MPKVVTNSVIKKIHLEIKKDDLINKMSQEFEMHHISDNEGIPNNIKNGYIKGEQFKYNAFCYSGDKVIQINGRIIEDNDTTILEYTYKKKKANKLPAFIVYNIILLGVIYYFNIYYVGIPFLLAFNLFLIFILKKDSMKKIKQFRKKIIAFSR